VPKLKGSHGQEYSKLAPTARGERRPSRPAAPTSVRCQFPPEDPYATVSIRGEFAAEPARTGVEEKGGQPITPGLATSCLDIARGA
jgi:hypothetical protein